MDGRKRTTDIERLASPRGSDSYAAGTYKTSDDTLHKPIMALVPDAALTPSAIKWLSDDSNPDTPTTPSPALKALTTGVGAGQLWVFEFPVVEIAIDVVCMFYYA